MTADAAIAVRDLRKSYGDLVAVDGISFEVRRGEVYGLLGHNGAGKSTTVEILEGHRPRSGGVVDVLGVDPVHGGRTFRDRIGIVLQSSGIEPELGVGEAIALYGSCYRSPRSAGEVLEMVGLADRTDARIGTLSGGQRRRLDLALGIVGRPELLFLDEPTTGFDPAARRRAWELLETLCGEGMTVLLTTHALDEAERLADRVGVLVRGQMVAEGAPDELTAGTTRSTVAFLLPDGVSPSELGAVLPASTVVAGRRVEFTTAAPTADLHAVTSWALGHGVELEALTVSRPSLEDVYLELSAAEHGPEEP